jgi:endonuclease/exonuclease/phosphatase family metal-dependent hydrolase
MRRSFRKRSRRIYREEYFILDVLAILFAFMIFIRYFPSEWMLSMEWFSGNQVIRFLLGLTVLGLAVFNFTRRRIRPAIMLLLPFAVIVAELVYYVPFSAETGEVLPYRRVRVATFNAATEDPGEIAQQLAAEDVDVGCLQELYVEYVDEVREQAKSYGYESVFTTLRDDAGMGNLIMSRYPVLDVDTISTSSWRELQRRFLSVHLDVHGQTVRVITVQLESTNRKQQLWGVIESWRLRLTQAEMISTLMEGSRGLVVLAGDLNATPTNRALKPLRSSMTDSWQVAGAGLGGTWHRKRPVLRIDAILYKGMAGAMNTQRYGAGKSDHLVYQVDLILPQE